MSRDIRIKQAFLRTENKKYPAIMGRVALCNWPPSVISLQMKPEAVFRSSQFLAQVFPMQDGARRLSVSRTMIDDCGNWLDGSTWDDLMRVKAQCGYGENWAIEIFPPICEIVNVANMRHLWLLDDAPAFAWRDVTPSAGG